MELSRRVGAFAVIGALVLRLGSSSAPQKFVEWVAEPEVSQLLLFLETGRRLLPESVVTDHEAESAAPAFKTQFSFNPEDADLVTLHSSSVKSADIPALLAISAADSGIIYLSAIQSTALCNSLDNGVPS